MNILAGVVVCLAWAVALSGCIASTSQETSVGMSVAPDGGAGEWRLTDCEIMGISHQREFAHLDRLLPPGLEPRSAAALFLSERPVEVNRGLSGVLAFDCRTEANELAGLTALTTFIEPPAVDFGLPAAQVDSHWTFAHTNSESWLQWLTDRGVHTRPLDDVHVSILYETQAQLPAGQDVFTSVRGAEESIGLPSGSIAARTDGGPSTSAGGHSEDMLLRVWMPTEQGLFVLDVDVVPDGTTGTALCQHDSWNEYAVALGTRTCGDGAVAFMFPEHDLTIASYFFDGVVL